MYMAFEYQDIIYAIKTNKITAGNALLIKHKIGDMFITIREILRGCFTFDKIKQSKEKNRINLVGTISRYNVLKLEFVKIIPCE